MKIPMSVLVLATFACGGQLADGDPMRSSFASEAPEPSGPEDGECGTWQLLSLDGPDGRRVYHPPYVELDLHPNGDAYRWTCAGASTGDGARCPSSLRRDCLVGKTELSGLVWRVRFVSASGARTEGEGEILDEPSGDIAVDGMGALHRGGHYRRVGAASSERCVP